MVKTASPLDVARDAGAGRYVGPVVDHADAEVEPAVEALWSAESERRAHQLLVGEATPVSWEHLLTRIGERRS